MYLGLAGKGDCKLLVRNHSVLGCSGFIFPKKNLPSSHSDIFPLFQTNLSTTAPESEADLGFRSLLPCFSYSHKTLQLIYCSLATVVLSITAVDDAQERQYHLYKTILMKES